MDIFKEYATDSNAELNGVLIPHGDATFKVARAGNDNYARELSRLFEENRVIMESKGELADKTSEKIMVEVAAKTLLLGWSGNVQYKGKNLPYSFENAVTLLTHRDFRRLVQSWAEDINRFRAKLDEEQLGN